MSHISLYNLQNLPRPSTFNVIWKEDALQTYQYIDGYIEGVRSQNKELADKIKDSFLENMKRVSDLWKDTCKVYLFWDNAFSFFIHWKDQETDRLFMSGGLIYHKDSNEFMIHT